MTDWLIGEIQAEIDALEAYNPHDPKHLNADALGQLVAYRRAIALIRKHATEQPHKHRADYKFGRARPTLTSIMPYCHNGEKVVTALCEICGTLKGFTLGDNAGFPDSGYWTECRACQSWTMFYRLDGHGYISRKHVGNGPGL